MRIMDRALVIAVAVLSAAGLATGCGGDDSDAGGDVDTGIAPNKLLSDVTATEAAQACDAFQEAFREVVSRDVLIRFACTFFGAASEDTPQACATARDMCITEANTQGSATMMELELDELEEVECNGEATLGQCSGTIGDLEACAEDSLAMLRAAFAAVSCDDAAALDEDDALDFGEGFQPAPSCEVVDCGDVPPFGATD